MGEAKRRGTLEERTRQAEERFKPQPNKKKFIVKAAPVVFAACLAAYPVGMISHKEKEHVPETAYASISMIMNVVSPPGSSTTLLSVMPPGSEFADLVFSGST
jgi:hypothetical protein